MDYDLANPTFSFKMVNDQYPLCNWQKPELKALSERLRLISTMTWNEVFRDNGLRYRKVPLPSTLALIVPPDATFCEMTVTKKARLMGYRAEAVFYAIWFDCDHDVFPQGKNRKR